MSIINFVGNDGFNSGDFSSSPLNYFSFPQETQQINLVQYFRRPISDLREFSNDNIIIGGGGMLTFPSLLDYIAGMKRKGVLISWGIGHNTHGMNNIDQYPAFLQKFDLNGIRDYFSPFKWVPCASCMSNTFDQSFPIQHEIIWYEHKDFRIDELHSFPHLDNSGQDFANKIAFLGSGETILTNSYHGAYWGLLLGRKVIVIRPFSSKFYGLHPNTQIAGLDDWTAKIGLSKPDTGFLPYCRTANKVFAETVMNVLTDKNAKKRLYPVSLPWHQSLRLKAFGLKKSFVKKVKSFLK